MRSISPPKNLFLRGIYLMTRRYLRHNVGIQSAALAFYLLFTLFPVLIFISALLGLLNLDVAAIIQALRTILFLRNDGGQYSSHRIRRRLQDGIVREG